MELLTPSLHWERLGAGPGLLEAYLHGAGSLLGGNTNLEDTETGDLLELSPLPLLP